jgi:YD repeat-containing protein
MTGKKLLPVLFYDAAGNISSMQRNGANGNALDNFSYTYQSGNNRLASITNAVNSTTYNYTYDGNGNVTSDQLRGISSIQYNNRNLPEQLTNSENTTVSYWYDGGGNRIRKIQGTESDEIYVLGAGGVHINFC